MMNKSKPSKQMLRRIREYSEEKEPELKKEQVNTQKSVLSEVVDNTEQQQIKAKDEVWRKKRIQEIKSELGFLVHKRQDEMRKRYEQKSDEQGEKFQEEQDKNIGVPEISTKSKRNLPFWGKRIKTAQQQFQPETSARRTSG